MKGFFTFGEEEHIVFHTPDSGPDKTQYCCSFHWFRLLDGRIVGLDLVRSEDTGKLCLRTFLIEHDGQIRGLVYEAPTAEWEPFETEEKPDLSGSKPALGRGNNWIAGCVKTNGQEINSVSFDLSVIPELKSHGFGAWMLLFAYMNVADFTQVHTTGWIEIDGTKYDVDNHGIVSLHYGSKLLDDYGYCATVFNPSTQDAPQILASSITGSAFRFGGKLLGKNSFTYAYGYNGVPAKIYNIGKIEHEKIPMGCRVYILLSDIKKFTRNLLGVETITASAQGKLYLYNHKLLRCLSKSRRTEDYRIIDLGQMILDYRGAYYTNTLSKNVQLSFTEIMAGYICEGIKDPKEGEERGKEKNNEINFHARITINDVKDFIENQEHEANLEGILNYPPFGTGMKIENGKFNLFITDKDTNVKKMQYRFNFTSQTTGKKYYFNGIKEIKRNLDPLDPIKDMTTLFTKIYEGNSEKDKFIASGILRFNLVELPSLIGSIEVKAPNNSAEKKAILDFFKFVLGELGETYVPLLFSRFMGKEETHYE